MPVGTQPVGDELDDLPIGLGVTERFKGLVEPLDAALGADEGTVLFECGRGGQDDVGELRSFGEEDVLHHEEWNLAQCLPDVVGVAVTGDGVFALDVERVQLRPCEWPPSSRGYLDPSSPATVTCHAASNLARAIGIVHMLVAGVGCWAWTRSRLHPVRCCDRAAGYAPAPWPAIVARRQQQV